MKRWILSRLSEVKTTLFEVAGSSEINTLETIFDKTKKRAFNIIYLEVLTSGTFIFYNRSVKQKT
jgi:hypothetical protein